MQHKDLVQLEVTARRLISIWIPYARRGEVRWVTPKAARHLIEIGVCRLAPAPVNEEPKPVAPGAPPVERKPFRASSNAPLDRFAVIERAWEGRTVVCIAGGPSVTQEMLELVRAARSRDEIRVAVVNDMYLVAPWADLLYFADTKWWEWHTRGIAKAWPWAKFTADEVRAAYAAFAGQKVTIMPTGMNIKDGAVYIMHNDTSENGEIHGLSERPNALRTGSNSGYQVLNAMVLAGAKRIPLVGYDMRFQAGRSHSHNGHPDKTGERMYHGFASKFKTMLPQLKKLGVEVINCTPGSAIEAFPRADLASVLSRPG